METIQLSLLGDKDKALRTAPVVLSATVGMNADQFPDILRLYVPDGSLIADVTWGKGRFWQKVDLRRYTIFGTDTAGGPQGFADFYTLPYASGCLDAVVLDPPYTYNGSVTVKISIAGSYNLGSSPPGGMAGILKMYKGAIEEARRVLRLGGILVIKCQDQVEAGIQRWIHVPIMQSSGFICEDLFVLAQKGKPAIRWLQQVHARKNHSFWIVLRKAS